MASPSIAELEALYEGQRRAAASRREVRASSDVPFAAENCQATVDAKLAGELSFEVLEGGEWRALRHSCFPEQGGSVRCFLPVVPLIDLPIPESWLSDPEQELSFWRSARDSFGLELVMAGAMLRRLLAQKGNDYLKDGVFVQWPSRDRHQLWATLWLALRLVPDRTYSEAEMECVLACHLAKPEPSLVVAMRADLQRRELLEAAAGGGCRLARQRLEFVLDGDKLFALRTAVTSRRPWWALPLAAQFLAAPKPIPGEVSAKEFRCVLLQPASESELEGPGAQCTAVFAAAGCEEPEKCGRCRVEEGDGDLRFAALTWRFASDVVGLEVALSSETRVPPFRVEAMREGTWRLLACQPMPTDEEICGSGRGATRCFLPGAVPSVPPDGDVAEAAAELLEKGALRRWPTKKKAQGLATAWLALQLQPGRSYREAEVDWLIATRHAPLVAGRPCLPDLPTVRKELERHGLVEREPGGGGFCLRPEALQRARELAQR